MFCGNIIYWKMISDRVGHNQVWWAYNSDLSDRYVGITFEFTDIIILYGVKIS